LRVLGRDLRCIPDTPKAILVPQLSKAFRQFYIGSEEGRTAAHAKSPGRVDSGPPKLYAVRSLGFHSVLKSSYVFFVRLEEEE
jgi:hypothetical protein